MLKVITRGAPSCVHTGVGGAAVWAAAGPLCGLIHSRAAQNDT
jgi:hypothetical protein